MEYSAQLTAHMSQSCHWPGSDLPGLENALLPKSCVQLDWNRHALANVHCKEGQACLQASAEGLMVPIMLMQH